jgi:TonB family protein
MFLLMISLVFALPVMTLQGDQPSTAGIIVLQARGPTYPAIALAAHVDGEVIVEVKINPNGLVTDTEIIDGHKLLRGAAEKAARRWLFASNKTNEKHRKIRLTFRFVFLADQASNEEEGLIFKPPYEIEIRRKSHIITTPNLDPPIKTGKKKHWFTKET